MWKWKKYVSVAERQIKAERKMNQLKKKGEIIEPVVVQGRRIVKNFWGKKWCEHLETFSDFKNRLPRGQSYVRNGSVCHLKINNKNVEAFVSGTKVYKVTVNITALAKNKWKKIKQKCSGHIHSLLDLLQGNLSDGVMEIVADHQEGLFPNDNEIQFSCNCPDWAYMCKHVAAVLYGIGSRFDEKPDQLFLLRNTDPSELLSTKIITSSTPSKDVLKDNEISNIFDIDLDNTTTSTKPKKSTSKALHSQTITGNQIRKIRLKMNLSIKQFADVLNVTTSSVYRWEKIRKKLKLHTRSVHSVSQLLEKKQVSIKDSNFNLTITSK